jgi:hypothetical protein
VRVGSRGFGWDVSFPQALASGRDYDLSTMLQERDQLEFRGSRFHLECMSSHPQLLFTESHRKKDRRSISKVKIKEKPIQLCIIIEKIIN